MHHSNAFPLRPQRSYFHTLPRRESSSRSRRTDQKACIYIFRFSLRQAVTQRLRMLVYRENFETRRLRCQRRDNTGTQRLRLLVWKENSGTLRLRLHKVIILGTPRLRSTASIVRCNAFALVPPILGATLRHGTATRLLNAIELPLEPNGYGTPQCFELLALRFGSMLELPKSLQYLPKTFPKPCQNLSLKPLQTSPKPLLQNISKTSPPNLSKTSLQSLSKTSLQNISKLDSA